MDFRRVEVSDRSWIVRLLREDPQGISDASFCYQLAYAGAANTLSCVAEAAGCLVFRWGRENEYRYSCPIGGGDKRNAFAAIAEHCRVHGEPFVLSEVPSGTDALLARFLPGDYRFEPERDEFDYVYDCASLAALAGSRYQNRRQMIHRFEEQGPWSYEDIRPADIADCREIAASWADCRMTGAKAGDPCIQDDISATERMLEHYAELGVFGGILRQCGRPVAFAVGEELDPETVLITFERAVPGVKGASAMLNREFVRRHCAGHAFLNRACDAGDPGLRQVKMKYCPCRLIEKFLVTGVPGGSCQGCEA